MGRCGDMVHFGERDKWGEIGHWGEMSRWDEMGRKRKMVHSSVFGRWIKIDRWECKWLLRDASS